MALKVEYVIPEWIERAASSVLNWMGGEIWGAALTVKSNEAFSRWEHEEICRIIMEALTFTGTQDQ